MEFTSVESNEAEHNGYYNYRAAEIVSALETEIDSVALGFTTEEHENVSNIRVWEIIIDVEADTESEYLLDGYNKFYFVIGENEVEQNVIIGAVRDKVWSEENHEDYVPFSPNVRGNGYQQTCFSYQGEVGTWANPSTITVKLSSSDGGGTRTLSFIEYCYIVTMYEYGSEALNQTARKASAMSIKNVAWQRIRLQKYASYGYDITTNEQAFGFGKTPTDNVKAAVDAIWNYIMLDNDYKLFFAYFQTQYLNNGEIASYAKEHGGCLSHYKADDLGNDNYTWEEILHYFYDKEENGVAYINEKVATGAIRIVNLSHAEVGGAYITSDTYHWKECTVCGCVHYKTFHNWQYLYSNYYRCSVCGHVKYVE